MAIDAARFDAAVEPGGYLWWYLDALSDDGRHGLALIAFVGSVFSPYYAAARRRGAGRADPLRHCAVNLALYGHGGRAWTMTERGAGALQRGAAHLQIGPSRLCWRDEETLEITVDERGAPWPARVRGRLTLHAPVRCEAALALDDDGAHRWSPIAPSSRLTVELDQPALRWEGTAYLDSNRGTRPLEADFRRWDWSRAALPDGRAALFYDVLRRDGSSRSHALRIDAAGTVQTLPPAALQQAPLHPLPRSAWGLARAARSDAGERPVLLQRWEDGPFYARSLIASRLDGEVLQAVHETVDLERFDARWVQALLPFRMPRRG